MIVRRPPANPAHRLHNSLFALAAVAVVSAAGLLAGSPLPAPTEAALAGAAAVTPATALALDSAAEAGVDAADAIDDAEAEADPQARKPRKHVRRSRQSLAVPYFSFARS